MSKMILGVSLPLFCATGLSAQTTSAIAGEERIERWPCLLRVPAACFAVGRLTYHDSGIPACDYSVKPKTLNLVIYLLLRACIVCEARRRLTVAVVIINMK